MIKECGNYVIRSINHEMYLKREQSSRPPTVDEKRRYINILKSLLWG